MSRHLPRNQRHKTSTFAYDQLNFYSEGKLYTPPIMASPPAAAQQAETAPAEAPAGQPAAPAVTKVWAKRGESGLPAHVRPV